MKARMRCDVAFNSAAVLRNASSESEEILILGLVLSSSPASCSSKPLAECVREAMISMSHLTMLDPNTYLLLLTL